MYMCQETYRFCWWFPNKILIIPVWFSVNLQVIFHMYWCMSTPKNESTLKGWYQWSELTFVACASRTELSVMRWPVVTFYKVIKFGVESICQISTLKIAFKELKPFQHVNNLWSVLWIIYTLLFSNHHCFSPWDNESLISSMDYLYFVI